MSNQPTTDPLGQDGNRPNSSGPPQGMNADEYEEIREQVCSSIKKYPCIAIYLYFNVMSLLTSLCDFLTYT
jgi:hypothetical protein